MGTKTCTKIKNGILKNLHKNYFYFGTQFKELGLQEEVKTAY